MKSALTRKTIGWQEVIFLTLRGSCIYCFWSIFRVLAIRSYVISHSMIVLASSKSFILNSFMTCFFNNSNSLRYFDIRRRSFLYISTIISFFSYFIMRIHVSVSVKIKLIFQKNFIIVLFQSFHACFNLYKLFNILQINHSWPDNNS